LACWLSRGRPRAATAQPTRQICPRAENEYRAQLAAAGFVGVEIQVLQEIGLEDVPEEMCCCAPAGLALDPDTQVISAFVKALKPAS